MSGAAEDSHAALLRASFPPTNPCAMWGALVASVPSTQLLILPLLLQSNPSVADVYISSGSASTEKWANSSSHTCASM